ncbi:MAG: deoxyguanosinetriphosphate triphosphohydrolase [Burkholderiaceae bacterium]|nr:deoxyguanosinetriphosphate triphosphohydrolase [Burkholderiaceae bacterium]
MDWNKLLSTKRLGKQDGDEASAPEPRTEFTRDYDRVIFSSAFRRLQDKTQVFPLAKSDYVRTRLTHSLEVASVGRSLGMMAADEILRKDYSLKSIITPQDLGTIVATASLMHDIGNPPFGHAGESAIQEWFANSAIPSIKCMKKAEVMDLLKFEGNAQGFRTLSSLQNKHRRGGMQLTCAVLGGFSKYPRESFVDESQKSGISGKKFGFMQSEAGLFEELADELGLKKKPGSGRAWFRHPLAYLVEAADDISYHVMDVEDGFKGGYLTFEQIEWLHKPWLDSKRLAKANAIPDLQRRAEYFRAVTIDQMIRSMIEAFRNNYDRIMDGSFDDELADHLDKASDFKAFKDLAKKHVYSARPVVEVEACGFEVIGGLLSAFLGAMENVADPTASEPSTKAKTILRLLPGGEVDFAAKSAYERAVLAADYISGMTDSYAVDLYQKIRGIALP